MYINVTESLQIKNGKYHSVLSYKENGKWKQKWVSTKISSVKGNKKKARAAAEQIRQDFENELNNTITIPDDAKLDFVDYMKKWLKIMKSSVEITTYNGYERQINGRLTDYFQDKHIMLYDLKPQHIQNFYQYLLDEGLKGNTVKHYHANIRKALKDAMRADIIPSNPADKVILPKIEQYTPKFYTEDEVKTLLREIKGTKLEIPVVIDCFYGYRREEVAGLKWSAIDFEKNTITINHTITQINGKIIVRDKTKTKSSKRTLPLEPILKPFLVELKSKQEEYKKLCGNCYNQEWLDYVCVEKTGNLIRPDYITKSFRRLLIKNDLKVIRFHDLRHSVASVLLKNGANMKEIQAWLGHSNYNTTANLYAHLDQNSMNNPARIIESALA